jgi:hypothetical protein
MKKKQDEKKKQLNKDPEEKKEEKKDDEKKGAEEEDGSDDEESIYCIHKLWHKATTDHGGHTFECKHPFNNAHIIFLCDRNKSMMSDDGGTSAPTLKFIAEYKEQEQDVQFFNNRLGSLYEAIYKFMKTRIELKCHDKCSAIVFSEKAEIAADHIETNIDFVQNYLLKFKTDADAVSVDKDDKKENKNGSNINLYEALNTMKKVMNHEEETIIVIMCDAANEDVSDDGAVDIIKQLKAKMKNKLSLQCVTLNGSDEKAMDELSKICKVADGKEIIVKNGLELAGVYMAIAKGIENVAKSLRGGVFMNQ